MISKQAGLKRMSSIYSTQGRMYRSVSVFFLLIYSVVAKTCVKNGELTAFLYQYSDSQVKCYTWCFGSALHSPISHLQGHKMVNPDKVLVLIKSSLWQSTEARTLSGFDCTTLVRIILSISVLPMRHLLKKSYWLFVICNLLICLTTPCDLSSVLCEPLQTMIYKHY